MGHASNHSFFPENIKWKKSVKTLLLLLLNVIVAAVIGMLALCGVYSLPTASIDKNVRASASVFSREGCYPKLYKWCTSQLDNFTDAIILLEAANSVEADSFQKAMLNYRGKIDDKSPYDVLIAHYEEGIEFTKNTTYPRYWHGYHIWIKPLLLIFNYQTIRIINGVFQLGIGVWICYRLFRMKKTEFIIPLGITYGMLMPVTLAKSLQFSSCFYVAAFSVLLLLYSGKQKACYVFLYAGILTAFFDFLTYPIATFGIPAVMYFALYREEYVKGNLVRLLNLGVCWGVGYIGMWSLKWIICGMITGVNVLENAQSAIQLRTSRSYNGKTFSLFNCVKTCFDQFTKTPCTYMVCAYCLWKSIMTVKNWRKNRISTSGYLNICIPFVLIALLPLAWYAMALNHSSIHIYFTNKAISVSVFALMILFTSIAGSKKRAV